MNIFICTKPLQIMVCMLINSNAKSNTLIIVDLFKDSDIVALEPKLKEHFKDVKHVSSRKQALLLCEQLKPSILFIDSDIGLVPLLRFLRLRFFSNATSIAVYEEGIGTYRKDIIKNPTQKILYKIIGAATHFGGSALTKYIYVYDLKKYIKAFPNSKEKALYIEKNLIEWIRENESDLIDIFSPNFNLDLTDKSPETNIYLSNWTLNESIIAQLSKNNRIYIKPHPHIKDSMKKSLASNQNIQFLPAQLPAEIIIIQASARFKKVNIYHHNSSALHYAHLKNVTSIDADSLVNDQSK